MTEPQNIKELITYWQISAEHDYTTMLGLFKIKRYADCLFYGHIVLEKILKALVVEHTKQPALYTHNLSLLVKAAAIELNETQLQLLDNVSRFNIRTRYPDIKLKFYKLCTKDYAEDYLAKIKQLYHNLCQKIDKKNLAK